MSPNAPYAVRKLGLCEPWWYVVDLRIPRAAILDPAAVVERFLHRESAVRCVAALNPVGAMCGEIYCGEFWKPKQCIKPLGHTDGHADWAGRTWSSPAAPSVSDTTTAPDNDRNT